jgi:hypothetical protein
VYIPAPAIQTAEAMIPILFQPFSFVILNRVDLRNGATAKHTC